MSTDENKALARRVFAELNGQSLQIVDEVMVPNYVHHDPSLPPDVQQGRDNYRNGVAMFYSAFPDLTCTIEDQIAEGDRVVTRLSWKGTHQGDLMGIPATGNEVRFGMVAIHRIANGKIEEGWVNFDAMGMMQQLGVVPAPEQSPA
jgi:steroid delta-isomerase-like uncharacterized protein